MLQDQHLIHVQNANTKVIINIPVMLDAHGFFDGAADT